MFEDIEKQIGFTLPNDYKFFLENYEGFEDFIGHEFVALWDMNEILMRNRESGIFKHLPLTIAIGNNPSSEFIGIEFVDNHKYRIVLSPFIDLDTQYHIEIGNSFTDFLFRLDNGKKWFE